MTQDFFENIKTRASYLEGLLRAKNKDKQRLEAEIKTLTDEDMLLKKTEKVLKHLIDSFVTKDLEKMDRLITYGLNTVYPDKDIKFKSAIEEYGKKVRIELQTYFKDKMVSPDSLSSVSVVESFLIKILCILKLKRARLLLMDETFPAVDAGYSENTSKLLAELASKLKIDILVVTHVPYISEYAHNSFSLTSVDNTLSIEKVK